MRKRIDLYIGGSLVDTDEQTYILLNYAFEDFSNPTAVLNSYTQQVTLPGTQRNNALFGELFRTDRRTAFEGSMGASYDPLRKTPFTIYDEDGTLLQSGYVKLDGVERKGKVNAFKVTLYGSLGSFLYGLMYDGNGDKRTLASLDFLGTGAPDEELTFTIDKNAVKDAWDDLITPAIPMWQVINFAPCYNGIPEGEFSADKGIFTPGTAGLPSSSGSYDAAHTGGYALANLPRNFDEWEVKDLRSYLQRPVVSMDKVMYAIAQPRNNGGWTVDYSDVQGDLDDLWMTLPLIPSLGTYKQSTGELTATLTSSFVAQWECGSYAINGSVPSGTVLNGHVRFRISTEIDQILADINLDTDHKTTSGLVDTWKSGVVFVQVAAYASGTLMAKSKVRCYSRLGFPSAWSLAYYMGFQTAFGLPDVEWEDTVRPMTELGVLSLVSGVQYSFANNCTMDIEAQDVDEYRVFVALGTAETTEEGGNITSFNGRMYAFPSMEVWGSLSGDPAATAKVRIYDGTTPTSIDYTTPDSVRSGAIITKAMLLGGTATPADYLVSLCKMNGWQILCDPATKQVTVIQRNSFFLNQQIDLTERVDTVETISLTPYAFTAKWYDFKHPVFEGEFAAEYKSAEGREYGIQRVNTGYEFDAAVVDLLQGAAFRSAVPVLEKSPCFYSFVSGASKFPSPFVYAGNSYTMQNASGETKEIAISALDAAIVAAASPVNEYGHDGYDSEWAWKVQLHKADGKPTDDGAGVLLWFVNTDNYPYYKLSDDNAAMTKLNGGACWDIDLGDAVGIDIPLFGRYKTDGQWKVMESLDFGLPAQMDIPYIVYDGNTTVYARKWKFYLSDRYARDTKVMRCKVRLDGLKVGQDLFRKFWWWGGSIWALNKITNHSLTGFATTECEFVQVQDMANYTNA